MFEKRKNDQPPPPTNCTTSGPPGVARPAGRRRPLAVSLLGWGLLAGVGPLLLLALAITLYGWVTGVGASGFPPGGTGPPTSPLSAQAASNAMGHALLYVFLFELPVFIVGSTVGAFLAIARHRARRERGRAERPAGGRESEEFGVLMEKLFGGTEEAGALLGRLFGGVEETAVAPGCREARVQPRPDGAGPPPSGPFPRPAAEGRAWWNTVRASCFWSLAGIPAGAVAGAAGVVLLMLSAGAGGSSDGSGGAIIVLVPTFGAVVGFLLGFAIPPLRLAWRIGRLGPVVGGTIAGAVAGVLLLVLAGPWQSNQDLGLAAPCIVPPVGAVAGFLLGFAPLRWDRGKLRRVRSVVGGIFAGAVAGLLLLILTGSRMSNENLALRIVPPFGAAVGVLLSFSPLSWYAWKLRIVGAALGGLAGAVGRMVLWFLAWVWGSLPGRDITPEISNCGIVGAVVGFLLGWAVPLIWQGGKILTTARQSKAPVETPAESGPLGEGRRAGSPRG